MTRRYPIAKLMRFEKPMWKAIKAHCKRTGEDATAYIRKAIARDLVLSKSTVSGGK